MVRYFYLWTPVFIVLGTAVVLSSAYLALIVLMLFSLVAVAALAGAIVGVPYLLGRAVSRRWQAHRDAIPQTAAVVSSIETRD